MASFEQVSMLLLASCAGGVAGRGQGSPDAGSARGLSHVLGATAADTGAAGTSQALPWPSHSLTHCHGPAYHRVQQVAVGRKDDLRLLQRGRGGRGAGGASQAGGGRNTAIQCRQQYWHEPASTLPLFTNPSRFPTHPDLPPHRAPPTSAHLRAV